MSHERRESKLLTVAAEPGLPMGSRDTEGLLPVGLVRRLLQRPRRERTGPRPLVVIPLLQRADVAVARLEPALARLVEKPRQVGEFVWTGAERLLRRRRWRELPDCV